MGAGRRALLALLSLLPASAGAAEAQQAPATPPVEAQQAPATPPVEAQQASAPRPPLEASDEQPGFVVARLPPQGQLGFLLAVGRPFESVSLDYGLLPALAVGVGYDLATAGFSRAGAHLRVRALRLGRTEVGVRLSLSAVLPQSSSGFGARSVARTADGELGLRLSFALLRSLALFGEGGVLGETDFGRPRTAAFLEIDGGAEWALVGPLSLVGRYGVIKGARGSARTYFAGIGAHF